MKDRFYSDLLYLKGITISKNVSVKDLSHMKIEAKFKYKVEINSFVNLKKVFQLIKKYRKKYYILGKGSNVLFVKKKYKGVLITLNLKKNKYDSIVNANDYISYLNNKFIKQGISSLSFLGGVPCSIGGAIYMNAGAFSKSIKDIIEYVYIYDIDSNKFKVLNNDECDFSYRDSYFRHHNVLILGAKIKIIYSVKDCLRKEYDDYLKIRKNKLPLEYPNLGSVFKNPPGFYAGKLIEDLGMKGLKFNDAMISNKHANVIINIANATGKDVLRLIKIIEKRVYKNYHIKLAREIILLK